MRSLEDLYNDVRDARVRPLVREAITAYNAAAFRSAVIATWLAVSLDVVIKVRELAEQGNGDARTWVARLDVAIHANDVRQLGMIESELLNDARDKFSLLTTHEHADLERLRLDRHVCAHPAFVDVDALFEPSAERVRFHLSTAVEHLLSQPPVPGRMAIARFTTDSLSPTWPKRREDLAVYLQEAFLARGTAALKSNLAKVIIKGAVVPPDGNVVVGDRLGEAAHVLHELAPGLLEEALYTAVTRRLESGTLTPAQAMRVVGVLGDLEMAWESIPAAYRPGLIDSFGTAPFADLVSTRIVSTAHADRAAADALERRLRTTLTGPGGLAAAELLRDAVAVNPAPHLWPHVVGQLQRAGSFRTGGETMLMLVLPFSETLDDVAVGQVVDIILTNNQVREAIGTPAVIEGMFTRVPLTSQVLAQWRRLADGVLKFGGVDPDDYYGYPDLRQLVEAAEASAKASTTPAVP